MPFVDDGISSPPGTSVGRDMTPNRVVADYPSKLVVKTDRHPSLWAILGDSRVDQVHLDHGNFLNISNANHLGWANSLSGHRITLATNQGNSGDRSDQMLARLGNCLAVKAGTLYILIGANDFAQAPAGFVSTAGTMIGTTINLSNVARHVLENVKLAHASALAVGYSRVIVCLEAGASNFSAAQISAMLEYNERLRNWSETAPNQVLFDLPSYLWNASASTASTIVFKTGYMRDTTHEAAAGAYAAGVGLAALITQLYPVMPRELRNVFEVAANGNIQVLTNPMFTTATGGVAGGGVTGSVPLGWTVTRVSSLGNGGGTQTCAVSQGTPADGSPGSEVILAMTFAAAGDTFALVQDWPIAAWGPGDIIQASGEIAIDDATGLAGAQLYLQANGSGNGLGARTTMDLSPIDSSQATTGALKISLLTEKLVVPAYTTKTWVTQHFEFRASKAGTVTARIRRAAGKRRYS
jgi:lysophospholipase L1-like esterase